MGDKKVEAKAERNDSFITEIELDQSLIQKCIDAGKGMQEFMESAQKASPELYNGIIEELNVGNLSPKQIGDSIAKGCITETFER